MAHSPVRINSPRLNLVQQLECGICTDIFLEPSVLECGHTFCSLCILTWHQTCLSMPSCPLCRAESLSPPTHAKDKSELADVFIAARSLELRRKGFGQLADEQERERSERRATWKALSAALEEGTPPPASPSSSTSSDRVALPAETRLARLEALATLLQLPPSLSSTHWRAEPADENRARSSTAREPAAEEQAHARTSTWADPTSRTRGFSMLDRMRSAGGSRAGPSTSPMGHPTITLERASRTPGPPVNAFVELPPSPTEQPGDYPVFPRLSHSPHGPSAPIAIIIPSHRAPLTPPQSPVGSWPSLPRHPSHLHPLSTSLEHSYPTPSSYPSSFRTGPSSSFPSSAVRQPFLSPLDIPRTPRPVSPPPPYRAFINRPSIQEPGRSHTRAQWSSVNSPAADPGPSNGQTTRWWER